MIKTGDFAQIEVTSAEALWDWLAAHHGQADSVWLVTWKKAPGAPYLGRETVLDALIAWGWIDGVRRALDAQRTMQLISPRRQQIWAESYRTRAARLLANGQMRPPGQAAIDQAKAAGLWQAWDDVDTLEVPDDLVAALQARKTAWDWFDAAAPSYRRNVLRYLRSAKRPDTRVRRIAQIADRAAEGRKLPNY